MIVTDEAEKKHSVRPAFVGLFLVFDERRYKQRNTHTPISGSVHARPILELLEGGDRMQEGGDNKDDALRIYHVPTEILCTGTKEDILHLFKAREKER